MIPFIGAPQEDMERCRAASTKRRSEAWHYCQRTADEYWRHLHPAFNYVVLNENDEQLSLLFHMDDEKLSCVLVFAIELSHKLLLHEERMSFFSRCLPSFGSALLLSALAVYVGQNRLARVIESPLLELISIGLVLVGMFVLSNPSFRVKKYLERIRMKAQLLDELGERTKAIQLQRKAAPWRS
jgi:hypothetical protein